MECNITRAEFRITKSENSCHLRIRIFKIKIHKNSIFSVVRSYYILCKLSISGEYVPRTGHPKREDRLPVITYIASCLRGSQVRISADHFSSGAQDSRITLGPPFVAIQEAVELKFHLSQYNQDSHSTKSARFFLFSSFLLIFSVPIVCVPDYDSGDLAFELHLAMETRWGSGTGETTP